MESATALQLGERLLNHGKLAMDQLARVRQLQAEKGGPLGPLLVQLGFISETDLLSTLHDMTAFPVAEERDYPPDPVAISIPIAFLRQHHAVPLALPADGRLDVALADPGEGYLVQAIELASGLSVSPRLGRISDIQAALARREESLIDEEERNDPRARALQHDEDDNHIAHLRDMASEAPVIREVNALISRALDLRASDIHIEPFEDGATVRLRIDGVMRPFPFPASILADAVVSRIKIMANLNIAERRLPQDGRIRQRAGGRTLDLRVSTVPTMFGESVVMRLLDRDDTNLELQALGFDRATRTRFEHLLAQPHGIVLVTGPTGSGKTTTLYAALSQLNTPERKILTVEDPVEYQLDGINQIPIKPGINLTFANALRAMLRQDPDVIMVGEMRDRETAQIAVQAALTGHKVFSTLHTNDAAGSITRLQDMQIDDYLIVSTLRGVVAQRLVRRLCPACKTPDEPASARLALRLHQDDHGEASTVYKAVGCPACKGTGYLGRTTISELMVMSDTLRDAIVGGAASDALQDIALQEGMADLRTDGMRKALSGVTSLDEIERVIQADSPAD